MTLSSVRPLIALCSLSKWHNKYSVNWGSVTAQIMIYCWPPALQSPAVTIYTTSLTFTNSTFCPHSVFMCFVWIWEQTAIISLKRKSKFVPVHALKAHAGSGGVHQHTKYCQHFKAAPAAPHCVCVLQQTANTRISLHGISQLICVMEASVFIVRWELHLYCTYYQMTFRLQRVTTLL